MPAAKVVLNPRTGSIVLNQTEALVSVDVNKIQKKKKQNKWKKIKEKVKNK